jgi:hypothetical protein
MKPPMATNLDRRQRIDTTLGAAADDRAEKDEKPARLRLAR